MSVWGLLLWLRDLNHVVQQKSRFLTDSNAQAIFRVACGFKPQW